MVQKPHTLAVVFEPHDIEFHAFRNTHNLPKETLERMLEKFNNNSESRGVDKEIRNYDADALADEVKKYIIMKGE